MSSKELQWHLQPVLTDEPPARAQAYSLGAAAAAPPGAGALGTPARPAAPLCSPTACGRRSFPPAASPASPPCRGCRVGRAGRTTGQEQRGLAKFCPDTCAVGAGTLTQARDHSQCGAAVRPFLFWATAVQGGLGWTPLGPSHAHLTHGHGTHQWGRRPGAVWPAPG